MMTIKRDSHLMVTIIGMVTILGIVDILKIFTILRDGDGPKDVDHHRYDDQ